jgi:hypothetical protein
MSARLATIREDFSKVLSEIKVDEYSFRVTRHPLIPDQCVLWLSRGSSGDNFHALGKFSFFSRRDILEFITRYTSNQELRLEVERRRFEAKIESLSPAFFDEVLRVSAGEKKRAFSKLFSLDSVLEQPPLETKRRIMAKRFHPDVGGDHGAMTVVNEAFEYLSRRPGRS